jgi:hypothetical protein
MSDALRQQEPLWQIFRRRLSIDQRAREERVALVADCITAGGHDWTPLPVNGSNTRHFITGEWPMWCPWCGARRAPGWTKPGEAP